MTLSNQPKNTKQNWIFKSKFKNCHWHLLLLFHPPLASIEESLNKALENDSNVLIIKIMAELIDYKIHKATTHTIIRCFIGSFNLGFLPNFEIL